MNQYKSPTQILTSALGLCLPGETSDETHICYLCGADIEPGATFLPDLKMPPGFTMFGAFKRNDGTHSVCTHCLAALNVEFMKQCSNALVTPKGVYRLASANDRAALFLNPPQDGPLVAWFSNKKMQHSIWRAPVSYEPLKTIFITVDEETVCANRELALKGWRAWYLLTHFYRSTGAKEAAKSGIGPASVKLNGSGVGVIFDRARAAIDQAITDGNKKVREAMGVLDQLSTGEWLCVYALHQASDACKIPLEDPLTWPVLRPLPEDVMNLLRDAATRKFTTADIDS
jgi:CRISPR type IV-associated protein Csf1